MIYDDDIRIKFNEKKCQVIDAYGVEWWFWNCECPKCGNKYLRNPKTIGRVICPLDKNTLVKIKPCWSTDGYSPKLNDFVREF